MTVTTPAELPGGFELPLEPRLPRIGAIDQVALEERAASLAKRSIKKESKIYALQLAVRMMDLTTLEGADTPGKVHALAAKAIHPDPADPTVPSCAAICVYPNLVPAAVERTRGSDREGRLGRDRLPVGPVARSRSSSPTSSRPSRSARTRSTWSSTAVRSSPAATRRSTTRSCRSRRPAATPTSRSSWRPASSARTTTSAARRCSRWPPAPTSSRRRPASCRKAATLPVLLCMLEAIRDVHDETGRVVGMKPAGGIRTAKQAIQNLVIVNETLGPDWLTPDRFRLGASSLLNDVLMQLRAQRTGRYQNPEHFTRD